MQSKHVIVRGAAVSGAAMVVSMAGQLGAAMIFTRVLPESDVGIYLLLLLMAELLIMLGNCGLWTALPKLVGAAEKHQRPRLIGSVLAFQVLTALGVGAAVVVVLLVVRDPTLISHNPSWVGVHPYLWTLTGFVLLGSTRENAMASLAGLNRYGRRAGGLIITAGLNVALVALVVRHCGGGLSGLVLVSFACYATAATWFYLSLPVGRRLQLGWPAYRAAVSFSAPLYANNLLTFLFSRLDTMLVAFLLGPAEAAFYELAARRLSRYGARALQASLVPYLPNASALIARHEYGAAARLMERASNATAFLCYGGILVVLAVREQVIALLFGTAYLEGLPALAPILVSTCMALQAGIMGLTLVALGKPHVVTTVNIFTAALSAGANLVLIPMLEIVGAGYAALLAMAFANAAQTWRVRRLGLRMDLRRYVQTHVFMVPGLALTSLCEGIGWRLAGIALFVALCFAGRTVTISQVRRTARILVPGSFQVGEDREEEEPPEPEA
jgi:O-antigen/teichoic acid export membrane protein